MFLKKIVLFIIFVFSFLSLNVFAVNVSIPWDSGWDYHYEEETVSSGPYDSDWKNLINTVNKYLWQALLVVSFAVLIYWWYILISSEWDQEKLKKANKLLIYAWIWIFVSISAYIVVDIVVDIF